MFDIISLLITRLSKLSTLKLLVLLSFTFVINILVMKLIFGDDFDSFFSQNIDLILILFGLAYAAISAIRYLDSSIEEKRETEETNISKIESIVSSYMHMKIEDFKRDAAVSISEEEKEDLLKDLRIQFESKLSEEYYRELKLKIKNEWLESEIDFAVRATTRRLKDEISTLKLRSNLNLVIGMILCFSGIIALFVFLQKNVGMYVLAFKDHNINEIILTLIPNAFFVLLIEIFSYFFLNLYKKSIEEIKFYQNELTNLESKFLALKAAKITNNHKLLCIILEEIVKTERNFILEQGQSTIDIEKEKISSTNSSNVIKAATDLLNFKK
ncbi:hypothetical protein [Acinetobacter baumannii]|uniref:hypothetical protein n=1 Tax=Acinetobacter baumannii TaxID=470 RepID=UPI0006983A5F|nr:hypothetical protein [Acinetobacter baumannii]MCO9032216.1 hypothetical protein [Acinetobacter baumannii]MCO9037057.1 hypothetical protein [Acinetobacter baumannii]USZ92136.1 hypothetical protein KQ251_14705 [Acinetobacter baumannii]